MTIRIITFAAFIYAGCTVAAAQDIAGSYRTEGTSTTGASYTENADIEMTGETTCRIKFSSGFSGICMLMGKTLTVSYLVHGKAGLGIYEVFDDGSIEGIFIDDFHGGGIGKEKLIPLR